MIIVPDIHGRRFWREIIFTKTENEEVVFLGDYLDNYEGEVDEYTGAPITEEDAIENFREILEYKKENPDTVTLLLGNHDAEYLFKECYPCRMYHSRREEICKLFEENRDLFLISKEIVYNGKLFLFTHAGITPHFLVQKHCYEENLSGKDARDAWEKYDVTEEMISDYGRELNEMWKNKDENLGAVLGHIGSSRGGRGYGSPVWADCNELLDWFAYTQFIKEPKMYQVVGHSQYNPKNCWSDEPYFRIHEHAACLDCRTAFRLYYFEDEAVDFLPLTIVANAKYQ